MDEVETKLDVHPSFHLPDLSDALADAIVVDRGRKLLRATYWDTEDLRLIRAGVTVRHRRGEEHSDAGGWQVKLPAGGDTDDALSRRELAYEGHASRPPPAVRGLVTTFTRGAPLRPVVRLHTRRRTLAVQRKGDVAAEVVDDEVSVVVGGRIAGRFRELEVELGPAGTARDRRSLVATLLAEGATESGQQPKLMRALEARAREPDDIDVATLPPDASPAAVVILETIGRVRAADPLVRRDEGGADDLAAALGELIASAEVAGRGPTHPDDGDATGPVNDDAANGLARVAATLLDRGAAELLRDTAIEHRGPSLDGDPPVRWHAVREELQAALDAVHHERRAALAGALDDAAYAADLDRLVTWARSGADVGGGRPPADALAVAWADIEEAPARAAARIVALAQMLAAGGVNTGRVARKARHAAAVARRVERHRRALDLLAGAVEGVSGAAGFVAGDVAHRLHEEMDVTGQELRRAINALDGKRLQRLMRGG